jgi:chaperone required for assembly of F1-ATPase
VHPTIKGRRRFYKAVEVRVVLPTGGSDDAAAGAPPKYEVTLDGRALKTPGRRPMHFESLGLAWGLAAEWDAQLGTRGIEPSTMPLMGLVSTWLDQTAEGREVVVKNVFKYLATDTCCYYAEPVTP